MIRGYIPNNPRFLGIDEVLTLHETSIDTYGGSHGLRDFGLLDSAVAMPRQAIGSDYLHEFPFAMAGAYLFHLCANHPFVDGNKRVALASCIVFLRLNGWELTATEAAACDMVLDVAKGTSSKDKVAEWLLQHVRPRPSLEMREFFRQLDYSTLGAVFGAIAAGQIPERVATILEAGHSIPSITQANIGAVAAEENGDVASANILRQHAMLLTAIYRIAEDNGYEW